MAGGILTIIMGAVPADSLHNWKWPIIGLAILTVLASLVQMILASHEDRELIKKIEILIAKQSAHDSVPQQEVKSLAPLPQTPQALETAPVIDGEAYRLVMSPRSVAWPLGRDLYKMKGRADEAVVDTDILVEMYLVNRASDRTRYVREFRLSAEVSGKRVEFKRQNDLFADDFNNIKFEYGLKSAEFEETQPIKQLAERFPLALAPEQPVEGWVRFMAKEINADKITEGTIVLTAIDSVGNEYPIQRVAADRERVGEIRLRRRR